MKQYQLTYLLARLPIGMSFFGHGLVRILKLSVFSAGLTAQFGKSILPSALVKPFSLVLPFLELLTGILLLTGLFTRQGIVLGWLIILALIFGSAMIEQWEDIFVQLFYALYLTGLFLFLSYNAYSVDAKLRGK